MKKQHYLILFLVLFLALMSDFPVSETKEVRERALIRKEGNRIIVSPEFLKLSKCKRELLILNLKQNE